MDNKINYTQRSVMLDIASIKIDDGFNTRKKIQNLDELSESIKVLGQTTAVGVTDNEDGTYSLVWGFRRVNAIKALNDAGVETPVLADIIKGNHNQLVLLNVQENVSREQLTMSEEYEACAKLSKFMTKSEICEALGVTPTWVTQRMKLGELSPVLMEAIDEGLSTRAANAINLLPVELHEEFAARAAGQSVSTVTDMVQERLDRIAGLDRDPASDEDIEDIELLDDDDDLEPLDEESDDDEIAEDDDDAVNPLKAFFEQKLAAYDDALSVADKERASLLMGAVRWSRVIDTDKIRDIVNILLGDDAATTEAASDEEDCDF